MINIKNEKIPENYEMVSFDAKSLFTSIPLRHSINIIIKRIYEKHEITTVFKKNECQKFLKICTETCISISIMIFIFRLMGLRWVHHWVQ